MIISAVRKTEDRFSATLPLFEAEKAEEKAAAARMNGFFKRMGEAMEKYVKSAGGGGLILRTYTASYTAETDTSGSVTVTVSVFGRFLPGADGTAFHSSRTIVSVWEGGYLTKLSV